MTLDVNPIANSWIDLAEENRGSDRFEVSYTAFRRIVEGEALTVNDLAAAVDLPDTDAADLIHQMVAEGRLRLDSAGERVVGAAGLSVQPSRHQVTMNGREFGVWCALDAVGIPAGLGADAQVESTCASTGTPVLIEIERGRVVRQRPESLTISLVPASVARSVHDTLCSRILFYSESPAERDPEADYLPVSEVADLGARLWRDGIPL